MPDLPLTFCVRVYQCNKLDGGFSGALKGFYRFPHYKKAAISYLKVNVCLEIKATKNYILLV